MTEVNADPDTQFKAVTAWGRECPSLIRVQLSGKAFKSGLHPYKCIKQKPDQKITG